MNGFVQYNMNTITYQIKSKYGGSCTECGNYIKSGTKVNWTPNKGIRHINECAHIDGTNMTAEAAALAIHKRQNEREAQSVNVGRVNVMDLDELYTPALDEVHVS
jgi:hypothetical protein